MFGQTHIFWGDGKGKTTSALGTALRACGNNYKVHLVQFMKDGADTLDDQTPGEIKALEKFPTFSHKRFGTGEWFTKKDDEQKRIVQEALSHLSSSLNKDYNIVIADEILYALQFNLLTEEQVSSLIENKPNKVELILTGSHKPFPNLFELADLVTEIKKIKHPYDKGILARKGIEY
jgi:cob(I)alamin adenosyltransferase